MPYRTIPQAILVLKDAWSERHTMAADTLIEADKSPVATGVVDATGTMIYRVPDQHPLGFDLTGKPRIRVKARGG